MKIPFYMTYPMQNLYQTEMEYEKDMERMKDLYPRAVKELLPRIEERCDELEYEGSRIYDENPDRLMMEREIQKLYEEMKQSPNKPFETEELKEEADAFALHLPEGWMMPQEEAAGDLQAQWKPGPNPAPPCRDWLCGLVGVLFEDEIYKRRCRYRRCHRWW